MPCLLPPKTSHCLRKGKTLTGNKHAVYSVYSILIMLRALNLRSRDSVKLPVQTCNHIFLDSTHDKLVDCHQI